MERFILIAFLYSVYFLTTSYIPHLSQTQRRKNSLLSCIRSSILPVDSSNTDDNNDFVNSISKPLPKWFLEQKEIENKILEGYKENRERILKEFKEKYDISEEEKILKRDVLFAEMETRMVKSKEIPWFKRALGLTKQDLNSESPEEKDASQERLDTKEKWKKLQSEKDEKVSTTFPSFFDLFPELRLKWPIWTKDKNGRVKKCRIDSDCLFPAACCAHPFLEGDNFCCTNWNKRTLEKQYIAQEISVQKNIQ